MSNVVQDPDVGPTKDQPSTQAKLDAMELSIRASKIRHNQQQAKLLEEANGITAYPSNKQAVIA